MKRKIPLAILILDYKTAEKTVSFVQKLKEKLSLNCIYVAIDNSNEYENTKILLAGLKAKRLEDFSENDCDTNDIFVITTGRNMGYAKGYNYAWLQLKRILEIEYVIISNNDLLINDPNPIIKDLLQNINRDPKIGVIGPKIIGVDGEDQTPCCYKNIWKRLIIPLIAFPLLRILKYKIDRVEIHNAVTGYYYRLMGSFMLIRGIAFDKCGMFDENTFLYSEEEILTERMQRTGYKAFFVKTVPIVHNHGYTIRKYLDLKRRGEIYYKSILYYFIKYRNVSFCEYALAYICILVYVHLYLNVLLILKWILRTEQRFGGKKIE